MKNIFIVWTNYQARVEGIVEDLSKSLGKFKILYRDNPSTKNKIKKIIYYIRYFFADLIYVYKNRPERIFVQIPPSYSLLAPILIRKVFRKKVLIVADCHNAMTRKPWLTRMGTKSILKNVNIILLHNDIIFNKKKQFFPYIPDNKLLVLEDKTIKMDLTGKVNLKINQPFVFIPSSFNLDEPVGEIIKVAYLLKNVKFVFTGNINKLFKNFNVEINKLPKNIYFTGWLSKNEYISYLRQANVLMGLTIYNDVQMSVSNEGLGAKKLMVLSDTPTLRYIYQDSAIYTKNNSSSIYKALKFALTNKDNLDINKIDKVILLKKKRYDNQLKKLTQMLKKIELR